MVCRIIYTGNMIPIFTWAKDNTKILIVTNTATASAVLLTTTSSMLAQVHFDDNGVTFKCQIAFQLPNNAEGNAPDYEYTWNYLTNVTCK